MDPRLPTFQVVCGSDGCAVVESVKFSRSKDHEIDFGDGKKGGRRCPKDGHKRLDEIGCILRD